MTSVPPPAPEQQLKFLGKLQRIFAEGDFTATYKFALLIALADLAVELGRDDGAPLPLSTRQVGLRFIDLYWNHALPYSSGHGSPGVLIQSAGQQAAIVREIGTFRREHGGVNTPQQAARLGGQAFRSLLTRVSATVSAQPLNYLQNFGGATDTFLYERTGPGRIQLRGGVAYCLRRFHPLVQHFARSHWVTHVKSNWLNEPILGQAADLEDFLFASSRQSLSVMAAGLRKLDGSACFYCGGSIHADADVDHFIPFSMYPRDLASNFVLAHAPCNRSKSDTLAARDHLQRWLERLSRRASDLGDIGGEAGIASDPAVSLHVATWAYESCASSGGSAWIRPTNYDKVDAAYLALLATGAPP